MGSDAEDSGFCAALHAALLADASPTAVEWVVTGRSPTLPSKRVDIQWWPPHFD